MISYEVYRVLHFLGIFMVLTSLSAMAMGALNAGSKNFANRKFLSMTHGIGMLISLVAGFGLMARLGLVTHQWPGWIYGKLTIWAIFGFATMLVYTQPKLGKVWWWCIVALGALAAILARYKPFSF